MERKDFDAFQEALLDGDTDQGLKIFNKLVGSNKGSKPVDTDKIRQEVKQELKQQKMQEAVNAEAKKLGAKYPMLDAEHKDANPALIKQVVEHRDFYMSKGQDAAEALNRAVKTTALEFDLTPIAAKEAQAEREKLKTEKPKSIADIDYNDDSLFQEGSEADLAKLRGDFVEEDATPTKQEKTPSEPAKKSKSISDINYLDDSLFKEGSESDLSALRGDFVE